MSIGENLRQAREKKGFSQASLAKAAELSVYTISRIECGSTPNPRKETLEVLASHLGVTLEDLGAGNGSAERRPRRPQVHVNRITIGPWQLSVSEDGALQAAAGSASLTIRMAG